MNRSAWKFVGAVAGFIVLAMIGAITVPLIFGVDPSKSDARRAEIARHTADARGESSDTEKSSDSGGCRRVASSKMDDIEEGLENGLSLSNAYAARSDDYEQVWMIAADINGPGVDDAVGVWASSSLSSSSGLIYAVDGLAREFSDWGSFGSVTDHGVRQARDCAS